LADLVTLYLSKGRFWGTLCRKRWIWFWRYWKLEAWNCYFGYQFSQYGRFWVLQKCRRSIDTPVLIISSLNPHYE